MNDAREVDDESVEDILSNMRDWLSISYYINNGKDEYEIASIFADRIEAAIRRDQEKLHDWSAKNERNMAAVASVEELKRLLNREAHSPQIDKALEKVAFETKDIIRAKDIFYSWWEVYMAHTDDYKKKVDELKKQLEAKKEVAK